MKLYLKILLILTFVSPDLLFPKNIQFEVDHASFLLADGNFRFEFYYSFPEKSLKYIQNDTSLTGELFISVKISSSLRLESEKKWIVTHKLLQNTKEVTQDLFGQKNFILSAGQYTVEIYAQDFYDTSSYYSKQYNLIIQDNDENKIRLSNIEIARDIEKTIENPLKWNEVFIKNNYYIVPHPTLILQAEKENLNSYIEIYNAKKYADDGLILKYTLTDAVNNIVVYFNKEIIPESDSLFDVNFMDISKVTSGVYYLNAVLYYPKEEPQDSVSIKKKLFILNSSVSSKHYSGFMENQSFEKSEFSTLTSEQTEIELRKIKIIASVGELDQMDLLTSTEAKQRLLFRFWQWRDSDTTTEFNEELFRFKDLVKYANKYFSFSLRPGWDTDRGRVTIKYGMPTQRDQHPQIGDMRAYEEWFYGEIQGGIYFYFVDLTGYNNYELVHSTANHEVFNDNWYDQYVLKNQNDSNLENNNRNNRR